MDKTDKACMLWNTGPHLDEGRHETHAIALYQIDGFYVEVFYHVDDRVIKCLGSFKTVDQLRPYLNKIDIGRIL